MAPGLRRPGWTGRVDRQELFVVRCGRTPAAEMPYVTEQLNKLMEAL
jgi:hypothetical protein